MSRTPEEMFEQVLSPAIRKSLENGAHWGEQWKVDSMERAVDYRGEVIATEQAICDNAEHVLAKHIMASLNKILNGDASLKPDDTIDNILSNWLPELARSVGYMAVLLAQSELICDMGLDE